MINVTISELLFEQFCEQNSIPFSRIIPQDYKTADYEVYLDGNLVIVEVKQINPNKDDEKYRLKIRQQGVIAYWEKSGRRVTLKIGSAKQQLKSNSQGKHPAILVLYDNVPIKSIDHDDIITAMYGQESINIAWPEDYKNIAPEILNVKLGTDSMFTRTHNTTFSGIALLYKTGDNIRLDFFHNIYARCPINPSWLRLSGVRQFKLEAKILTQSKSL
jgi:hypothetical protein